VGGQHLANLLADADGGMEGQGRLLKDESDSGAADFAEFLGISLQKKTGRRHFRFGRSEEEAARPTPRACFCPSRIRRGRPESRPASGRNLRPIKQGESELRARSRKREDSGLLERTSWSGRTRPTPTAIHVEAGSTEGQEKRGWAHTKSNSLRLEDIGDGAREKGLQGFRRVESLQSLFGAIGSAQLLASV
jgi:hypothetical protein